MGCAKKASIEGKLVDGKGMPMSGAKIVANQVKALKGYEHFETTTSSDGTFKFVGVFPSSEYSIEPLFESGKALFGQFDAQSGPEGQTRVIGSLLIRFIQKKDGILADSKTGLEWVTFKW